MLSMMAPCFLGPALGLWLLALPLPLLLQLLPVAPVLLLLLLLLLVVLVVVLVVVVLLLLLLLLLLPLVQLLLLLQLLLLQLLLLLLVLLLLLLLLPRVPREAVATSGGVTVSLLTSFWSGLEVRTSEDSCLRVCVRLREASARALVSREARGSVSSPR